jgi:ribonuclease H / adenosylcobalamin/alpha-ribazole phosphatase
MARHFVITADGGSRGNPGPAAFGAVVSENGKVLKEISEAIGLATNNAAEYKGLLAALTYVNTLDKDATVEALMDSKLVVEQMSGRWQIKHENMRELAKLVRQAHPSHLVTYQWIPREENFHADRLVNEALDGVNTPREFIQINFLNERLVSDEKPTRIYFIRHGETVLTPSRIFSGAGGSDPELSARGREEAASVAEELALRNPDAIIASPMVRTRQTAQFISEITGIDHTYDEAWIEASFGRWDGLSVAEVKEKFPEEYREWVSSASFAQGGGESYEDVMARTEQALADLVTQYPGKTVVVVTHNVVVKAAVCLALSAPIESIFHVDIAPCSITTIDIWPSDGLRALRSVSEKFAN